MSAQLLAAQPVGRRVGAGPNHEACYAASRCLISLTAGFVQPAAARGTVSSIGQRMVDVEYTTSPVFRYRRRAPGTRVRGLEVQATDIAPGKGGSVVRRDASHLAIGAPLQTCGYSSVEQDGAPLTVHELLRTCTQKICRCSSIRSYPDARICVQSCYSITRLEMGQRSPKSAFGWCLNPRVSSCPQFARMQVGLRPRNSVGRVVQ